MSIPFITSEGLFTRIGHQYGSENVLNTARGSATDTRIDTIFDDFVLTDQTVIDGLYSQRDAFRTTGNTLHAYYMALSRITLQQMAHDDLALSYAIGTDQAFQESIDRLNADLDSAGSGIEAPTLTLTVTENNGSDENVGDAVLVVSKYQGDGHQVDYMFTEEMRVTVTNDSGRGGTAYQEAVSYVGDLSVPVNAYNWPQGSGANKSGNIVSGDATTKISNGGFETWPNPTTTMATGWTLMAGSTINVRVKRNTSVVLPTTASASCEFVGDGSTLIGIQQTLSVTQDPAKPFGVNVWIRLSGVPAAGSIRVRLVDGSDAVIADAQGVDNTFTQLLTSGVPTSSWLAINSFFRLPETVPTTVKLEIAMPAGQALSNGTSLYIEKVALTDGTQLYNGGWYAALFSGGTKSQKGDFWTVEATNSKTTTSFVRQLDRNWGLRDKNRRILTGGGISDSLIA